jgi:DNA-binding MarR family transcriptional regulator
MKNYRNKGRISDLLFESVSQVRQHIFSPEGKGGFPFSFPQMKIMNFVRIKKNPTMKEIADYLFITPPSATFFVESLVKTGQLDRILDDHDRRIVRLAITKTGQKTLEKGAKIMSGRVDKLLSVLTEKQIENFIDILETISIKNK